MKGKVDLSQAGLWLSNYAESRSYFVTWASIAVSSCLYHNIDSIRER
jgi:hypothetical protein